MELEQLHMCHSTVRKMERSGQPRGGEWGYGEGRGAGGGEEEGGGILFLKDER